MNASHTRIPTRWRWHYQQLLSLRDNLLHDHDEQRAEAVTPLESHSMHMADSATDEFDHDLSLSFLSHQRDALYEIEAALRRIADGTYGLCEESGLPIPPERLQAVPWARHTQSVEARLEREGPSERLHLGTLKSLQQPTAEASSESNGGGFHSSSGNHLTEPSVPP